MRKTITCFVTFAAATKYSKADINLFTFNPTKSSAFKDDVLVKTQEVEIEVPDDFDPRPSLIKNKEAELMMAKADFAATVTRINREISELQAIELAPGGAA